MKKLTGWVIIILCSLFLMMFLATFFIIVHSRITNPEDTIPMTTTEIVCVVVGYAFVLTLLIIGLVSGIKKIKKGKTIQITDYTDTLDISLTGKISYKDYRNLNLKLSFGKPIYIIFICLIFLCFLPYLIDGDRVGQITNFILFLLFICFILLIIILIRSKRIYRTDKAFQGQLNYKFTNDSIQITTETVNSIIKWSNFYKMKETKDFFLFYQSAGIATLLYKKMFTDTELANFKQFICSLNLKK